MTSNTLLTTIALATAIVSGAAVARSDPATSGEHGTETPTLQIVANSSEPDQEAYGWQYFSDPRAVHAVVISPAGAYFLSLGGKLRQVTGPAGEVLQPNRIRVVGAMP